MRVQLPQHTERFGAVRIHEPQEVLELDSGLSEGTDDLAFKWQMVRHVPYDVINAIERRMAIVVPCKGERLKVLEGVLSGIPHDCLIINGPDGWCRAAELVLARSEGSRSGGCRWGRV